MITGERDLEKSDIFGGKLMCEFANDWISKSFMGTDRY